MNVRTLFSLEILSLLIGIAILGATYRANNSITQSLRFVPPPPNVERFSFGYNETMADLLWLRVIQDLHVCENAKNGIAHQAGEKHVGWLCERGWVYKMINAITELSPKWRMPYVVGATMLSIVVDDRLGATDIFNKGVARYPDDVNLLYRASYHFIWEEKQPKIAADLLTRAARNGGPKWFYSLAGKLYTQAGQAELAKVIVEDALKTANTPEIKERLENRLREVNNTLHDEAMKKPSESKK